MGRAGQEVAIPQKRTTEKAEKTGIVHNSKVKKELAVKKPASSNGENGASATAAKSTKPKVPQAAKQPGTANANPKSEKSKSSTAAAVSVKKAGTASSAPSGKKANGIRPVSMPPAPDSSSSKAHPNNNNLSSAAAVKPKKMKRRKPGSRTDSEIIRYQKSKDLLIQKAPFRRHLKSIVAKFNNIAGLRYQGGVDLAMREATEHYLTDLLRDARYGTAAFKRVTMDATDILFVRRIRKEIPMEDTATAMDVDANVQQ